MNSQWQAHLDQQGAITTENGSARFADDATPADIIDADLLMIDLSHLGVLEVRGEDAESFLQGQLANDVTQVSATHSQLNTYCSPKGRILSSFRIIRRNDGYLLVMPRALVDSMRKRLSMFVLRARVELTDLSDELICIGLAGPDADTTLKQYLGDIPAADNDVMSSRGLSIIRVTGSPPRFLVLGPVDEAIVLWNELRSQARLASGEVWTALDIRAGMPEITPELQDQWVPQMVNLQVLGGISFKKGCYPGQEIVARTEYLGKLKRRMYRVRIDAGAAARPADEVFDAREPAQGVGRIVSAVGDPERGYEALAVLQIEGIEDRELHVGNPGGPRLTLLELPYSVGAG